MVLAGLEKEFMIAMEHVLINGGNPAMANVLRDMLSVVDIATVNHIMTSISIFVKARGYNFQKKPLPGTCFRD